MNKAIDIDRGRLRDSGASGFKRGWRSSLWVMKILLPVSFLTALLDWTGWLYRVDFPFESLMNCIGLPGTAAVPLVIAMLTGIYGGIAAMSVLSFTLNQMTLMAVFMMICHSLIQEGMIQGKSGLHPVKAGLLRFAAAIITVWIVSLFLETPSVPTGTAALVPHSSRPLGPFLESWALSTLTLSVKIFAIIVGLQVVLEIFRDMGWLEPIIVSIAPILKLLGLHRNAGVAWMTGVLFGLIYGSAVIMEEIREGLLTREEVEKLHLFIGINHSFIEDPIIFMAQGLSFFWLWVPRLAAAIISVHFLHFWQGYRKRKSFWVSS